MSIIIESGENPYRDNVQGKANEPITVAGLLHRAERMLGLIQLGHSLDAIYDRLQDNAPRIALIGGSADHPAHILDLETALRAAVRIWQNGGVPFYFSIPVVCDATAQSNIGMAYSLHSRNLTAEMVIEQLEAHSYHGAFVLSGCDKTPLGIACGLALLDRTRRQRGDAPVWASFCPSHVLRGGVIPPDLRADLEQVAGRAASQGYSDIADDLHQAMSHPLQCIANSAFQGILTRARQAGLIAPSEHQDAEKRLAVHTCHPRGGICAFNGTGNSSRIAVAGLGLTHPAVELLPKPPTAAQIEQTVDGLFACLNRPEYSVSSIVTANWANAVRIHSAAGGSTNLMMHLVAVMRYAGRDVSVWDMDDIRRHPPTPDLFDYSLSQGRDLYALACQCSEGLIRGIETLFYELVRNGAPMDLDAPTVTASTWRHRLADKTNMPASGVNVNPIILSQPRRPYSGIEVLQGNFFDSAVVKISGMSDEQLAQFDDQVAAVLFFENEPDTNAGLLDIHLLDRLRANPALTPDILLALARHNTRADPPALPAADLFDWMIAQRALKIAVIISGQGPEAFGMPEMFTPMQHINSNQRLRPLTMLISDGRYSGTSYGAAIGHVTPEAFCGGGIGLLQTGDLLHVQLSGRRIDLLDAGAFAVGRIELIAAGWPQQRRSLARKRRMAMRERQNQIAVTQRMRYITDAGRGAAPRWVLD